MHDYALRPGKAYWVHVHEPGNITLPGVGGSPPQSAGQTFAFSSLQFHNGTKLASVSEAATTYDWMFINGGYNYIYYYRASGVPGYDPTRDDCGGDPNCKTTISPWEGYFIWSKNNNITMLVNE